MGIVMKQEDASLTRNYLKYTHSCRTAPLLILYYEPPNKNLYFSSSSHRQRLHSAISIQIYLNSQRSRAELKPICHSFVRNSEHRRYKSSGL